jgi:hypothetical protein
MTFHFSERAWSSQDILNYWQEVHGKLDQTWQERFLANRCVKLMCRHHPAHIKRAIANTKKIELAHKYILSYESENEEIIEALLDEHHPDHSMGIINAHHGNRTTDPFDPQREDRLFKCEICNLKLSVTLISNDINRKICTECYNSK